MQRPDNSYRRGRLAAGVRVHGRDERADLLGRLGFRLQEVDELEARVIVDEHQGVLVTAEEGAEV